MIRQEMMVRIKQYLDPMPDIDSDLVVEAYALLGLHHEMFMLSETVYGGLGLNARQMETMEALFHHKDRSMTPVQLTEVVPLTRSAMTSNLDALERKGFLVRSSHKEDRRMVAIILTEKGIQYCEEMLPLRYRDIARVVSVLTAEEKRIVYDVYSRIIAYIKQALTDKVIGNVNSDVGGSGPDVELD